MTRSSFRLRALLVFLVVAVVPAASAQPSEGRGEDWVEVSYGDLVDGRRLSQSGQAIETLLGELAGRPYPAAGERPQDASIYRQLEPLLERYAFVLPDAVDALEPLPEKPMIEVASLWQPGEAQPAWVELLRSRRYVVESDGDRRFRVFAPTALVAPSEKAAIEAWASAWPVLRHVVAAELRRQAAAGRPAEGLAAQVRVFPYRHDPARTRFLLGAVPYELTVTDTGPRGNRPQIDLEAWRSFVESGLALEGGRLGPDGEVRLLGSETEQPPTLLGRPIELSDYAVAYRAVFHGGLAEPYMSLDRAHSPHVSNVSYGGRLGDTALGLVSLLCDVRFKTFSLGIDLLRGEDVRQEVRRGVNAFKTHLEHLSADPGSQGVSGQQTRMWFYPDTVDLTLSPQADVLVIRRGRMAAASERVEETTWTAAAAADPPWTRTTIGAINGDYDELATLFPELRDLDQVVRLLSLFSWLRLAAGEGVPVAGLDALLAVELPPVPTPRRFPQLVAFNALPLTPGLGVVEVIDRTDVGEGLDRLLPSSGRLLPAALRLQRALASLDRRRGDHAALLDEVATYDLAALGDDALDLLAYRAERLRMHALVLGTIPSDRREALVAREKAGERIRVFSVSIGGLDLGMDSALERASRRAQTGLFGTAASRTGSAPPTRRPRVVAMRPAPVVAEPRKPATLPPGPVLPDHGGRREVTESGTPGTPGPTVWELSGADGPWPQGKRLFVDRAADRALSFERLEDGRLLRYGFEIDGDRLRATVTAAPGPPPATPTEGRGALSKGLALLEVVSSSTDRSAETVGVRMTFGDRSIVAPLSRSMLQRLALGPSLDPGRADLPGLSPLPDEVGAIDRVMVALDPWQLRPPWDANPPAVPGEEDPLRIAAELQEWWDARSGESRPAVAVGVDAVRSPPRWDAAPPPGKSGVLVLPEDAFPGLARRFREPLEKAWTAGDVVAALPSKLPKLVVLASGEAPALLGARVRRLASRPEMKDRFLAVVSLSGEIRTDLAASLASEGHLASLGVASFSPVGLSETVSEIEAMSIALAQSAKDTRIEEMSTAFVWFY